MAATIPGRAIGDANGHVIFPSQSAFLARPTSTQDNLSINSNTTIAFGTEVFDQNADFASNTFTAPVTGKYLLSASFNMTNQDSAAYHRYDIVTSNRNFLNYHLDANVLNADGYYTFNITVLADMDASDTAYVRLYQAGGTAQQDVMTDSHFSGFLAC